MKSIYKKNVDKIQLFYKSDLYEKDLKGDFYKIKKVIEALYDDPDEKDADLLKKAAGYNMKLEDKEIVFSPDGICGWKILFDVYSKNGDSSWLEKYGIIRGSKYGELFFPGQKDSNNNPTINMERNTILGDRIDMFLFDLKRKLEGKMSRLSYSNENSACFCKYYSCSGKGFKEYIDRFELKDFIIGDGYAVKNIVTGDKMTDKEWESFSWSNRYNPKTKKEILEVYLDNLITLCKDNPKKLQT